MIKKRIVFIHLYNDRSGSPKVLLQTARALSNAGYDIEVFTSSHKGGFLDDAPGSRRTLFYRRSNNKIITLLYYLISQTLLFFQCFQFYRQDVVFHINTMMPFGASLAAKCMRKTVIYHVHESSIRPNALKFFLRKIIKFTSNGVIFVSKFLEKKEGFGDTDVVVYNALDVLPDVVQNKQPSAFKVLMVCSLKRYKGVDEFLEIAKKVSCITDNIVFELVLNANDTEIEAYFKDVTLPDCLTIFSRQEDLKRFYSSSSLLVNLSRPDEWVETFGLTLLEAMSYYLPVIAPPVGGPTEIIQHNIQGLLIDSCEIDRIADSILELESNPKYYDQMAKNAHRRSLDFMPERFANEIVKFYQKKVL